MNKIRIVLADDHQILVDGLRALLVKQKDVEVVAVYDNGLSLYDNLDQTRPDIALIDINMPGMNGYDLSVTMAKEYPDIRIIALSMHDDAAHIVQLIDAGVRAYLFKNVSNGELVDAVRAVAGGKHYFSPEIAGIVAAYEAEARVREQAPAAPTLTARELELLKLIAREYTNGQIAATLFISERTVETHRKNMLRKTGHKNMLGLLKYVMDNKLI